MALTQERLKELLTYSPETGLFYWAKKTCKKVVVGKEAGCRDTRYGYVLIGIDGIVYLAHRLAWLYVYGELPEETIDHANGDPSDNKLCNLRAASSSENQSNRRKQKNNTSGFKGVVRHQGRWMARVGFRGKTYRFSGFDTPEEAAAAYDAAARKIHGEFARLNEAA